MKCCEIIEVNERSCIEEVVYQSLDYDDAIYMLGFYECENVFDYIRYDLYIYEI